MSLLEDVLGDRAPPGELLALFDGCRKSELLRDLVRGGAQEREWLLSELRALAECDPTTAAYRELQKAELFFRAIRVGPGLFRSCQPREQDLRELRDAHGLEAVVNLRAESEVSRTLCRRLELRYHFLPIDDGAAPTLDQVGRFLSLVRETGALLVHCHAGKGRTGTLVACYRVDHGMALREALELSEREVGELHPIQRELVGEFVRTRGGAV
ncbi:MAG: tyrosine-protein phosphatase [Armatimonadetes bacterium]|nr:tyrosine-protein phosphatase [Armatimonadota bacterium]